ncbi:MAG: hypothetical protein KBS81_07750, partial [Spirochaetales bacterium]|nr:hypothetical protein [Candidatus Physcosoma equi]
MKHVKPHCQDERAKRILSKKIVLAVILRESFPVFRHFPLLEIVKYIDPDAKGDSIVGLNRETHVEGGKTIQDLVFPLDIPYRGEKIRILVNLEMQVRGTGLGYHLQNRELHYWSSQIARQHGETFKGTDYDGLLPVASIWVVMEPEKSRRGTWIRTVLDEYRLNDGVRVPLDVKQQLNAILEINLGKSEDGVYTGNAADRMLRILFEEELSEEETRERLCAIGLPEVADALKEEPVMEWGLDEYYRRKAEKRYLEQLRARDRA